MAQRVSLHPQVVGEAGATREWYEARSPAAAEAFVLELDHAIDQIGRFPRRWPSYFYGTRRFLLHRYPFSVIYRKVGSEAEIPALAHASRRPGY
jgi:plasmid stabilization system protein ParE